MAQLAKSPGSETKSNKSLLEKMNRNQPMTQPSAGKKTIRPFHNEMIPNACQSCWLYEIATSIHSFFPFPIYLGFKKTNQNVVQTVLVLKNRSRSRSVPRPEV